MNIILMGPQGSGKGTQAKILAEKFGLFYFEAGKFLREIADKNEALKKIMDKGELVPDTEMCSYVQSYLDEKQIYDNILFDGFPRDLEQYNFLKNWFKDKDVKLDAVIILEISEEETLKRLIKRAKIEGRGDDNPESIKKRLNLYHTRTQKLISDMQDEIREFKVNGERSVEEIAKDLEGIINDQIKNSWRTSNHGWGG